MQEVHFSLMLGFSASKRSRRRRSGTIRSVAIDLGIHERTLRRWIAQPKLRPHLRAYRHGKQWRLVVPKTDAKFERYIEAVRRAVKPFRRKRRKRISRLANQIARAWGYGNEQRERDLRTLHLATQLKIANAKPTSVFKAKSKLAERTQTDRSADHIFEARIIAAKYGCHVFDVPKYLDRWLADEPTRQMKNLAWRMRQLWPTREQWDKASDELESRWRERTLTEAVRELADLSERINGANLASRLFLNQYREHAWKANEKQKEFQKRTGESVMLDPYGKLGISLRLFRQRYDLKDIQKARAAAEGTVHSEQQDGASETDESGYGRGIGIERPDDDDPQHKKISRGVSRDYVWKKKIEEAMRDAKSEDDRKKLRDYLQREFPQPKMKMGKKK